MSSVTGIGLLLAAVLHAAVSGSSGGFWTSRAARRIGWFGVFLFLAQLFFTRQGPELARLPFVGLPITELGVTNGLLMAGRFLVCVAGSFAFVATTDPGDLAYDLMQRGLPYRYGFALVTMLRFMPLVGQESETVRQAQAAQGINFEGAGLRRIYANVRFLLLPVLVSSLERVDTLAVSMEGRAFGLTARRTYLRRPPRSAADPLFVILVLAVCGAAIFWL